MKNCKQLTCALAMLASLSATAQSHVMDVDTRKAGAPIQSTMYGLFFEDINYAADGGIYGELVKNRSFEFPQTLIGTTGPSGGAPTMWSWHGRATRSAAPDCRTRATSASA